MGGKPPGSSPYMEVDEWPEPVLVPMTAPGVRNLLHINQKYKKGKYVYAYGFTRQ